MTFAGSSKLPEMLGVVPEAEKFDNEFFGVSDKNSNILDIQMRKTLEVAYEAILDAGRSD